MAVSDGEAITVMKDMGLVTTVFDERKLSGLRGHLAIGHTRYSTAGTSDWMNAQPVFRAVGRAGFVLAHNGNLTNTDTLAGRPTCSPGWSTPTATSWPSCWARPSPPTSPSGPAATTPVTSRRPCARCSPRCRGPSPSSSLDADRLIGVRDPNGFRPLCLGRLDATDEFESGWVLASESPALDVIGATFIRELDARRDGGDRRQGGALGAPLPPGAHRPEALHLRVRLLRPARHHPLRQRGPRRPPPDGPAAGRPGPGRRRPGDGGPRLGGARRRGVRLRLAASPTARAW